MRPNSGQRREAEMAHLSRPCSRDPREMAPSRAGSRTVGQPGSCLISLWEPSLYKANLLWKVLACRTPLLWERFSGWNALCLQWEGMELLRTRLSPGRVITFGHFSPRDLRVENKSHEVGFCLLGPGSVSLSFKPFTLIFQGVFWNSRSDSLFPARQEWPAVRFLLHGPCELCPEEAEPRALPADSLQALNHTIEMNCPGPGGTGPSQPWMGYSIRWKGTWEAASLALGHCNH